MEEMLGGNEISIFLYIYVKRRELVFVSSFTCLLIVVSVPTRYVLRCHTHGVLIIYWKTDHDIYVYWSGDMYLNGKIC